MLRRTNRLCKNCKEALFSFEKIFVQLGDFYAQLFRYLGLGSLLLFQRLPVRIGLVPPGLYLLFQLSLQLAKFGAEALHL